MEIGERLKWARIRAGFKSAAAAARAMGIKGPTYSGHENGARGGIRLDDGARYATKFKVSFEWLMTGKGDPGRNAKVPIVGHVGAGAEVYPDDAYPKGQGLDMVEPPIGASPDCVAVRIQGDSMHPFRDGWLIFYRRDQEGVSDDCLNQLCVVKVSEGPTLFKELRRGRSPKLWTLHSWNAPPRESVRLDWAARVIDIRPA